MELPKHISSETAVRIMVYNIREKNPDAIKFEINIHSIRSILFYLECKKYNSIMYVFGYKFLLEILNLFEEYECYEECLAIKTQIEYHNKITNDNIKTKTKLND